ncbi:hypothetical protein ACFFX0_20700 [Citricoccus parietis]|uniref:Uncharacterized protein n=1 Tax=Citricoccus parietis TaxID=592307 RepID=A0ABV5G3H8_9MICC
MKASRRSSRSCRGAGVDQSMGSSRGDGAGVPVGQVGPACPSGVTGMICCDPRARGRLQAPASILPGVGFSSGGRRRRPVTSRSAPPDRGSPRPAGCQLPPAGARAFPRPSGSA